MSISSIVVRGFGSFGNGLLAILGFGAPVPIGPGICGDGASFVGMAFDGAVASECGVNGGIELGAVNGVVFSGAQDGALVPVDAFGGEYT
jgi:hypothetical protein